MYSFPQRLDPPWNGNTSRNAEGRLIAGPSVALIATVRIALLP
jgi:hypothetical protein